MFETAQAVPWLSWLRLSRHVLTAAVEPKMTQIDICIVYIVYGGFLKWRYPKIIQNKTISISKPKKFREKPMTHDGPWDFGVTHSQSKKNIRHLAKGNVQQEKNIIFQNHPKSRFGSFIVFVGVSLFLSGVLLCFYFWVLHGRFQGVFSAFQHL